MYKKVLILAPHSDDGEFGCGGTIAKLIEEKSEVYYVAFSSAEQSVPDGFSWDVLRHEVKRATKSLGISNNKLILFDFEVRRFPQFGQEILEEMVKLNRKIKPDFVFLPCSFDIHQDHKTIYEEGLRAFKYNSILGHEIPWNNLFFETKSFVHLEKGHINRKISALKCYKSQSQRNYVSLEFIKSMVPSQKCGDKEI